KEALAKQYLEFLGGEDNIDNLTNCATRLRVNVKDPDIVASDAEFRQLGATGVVRNNNALQVIVGTSVQNLRENIDEVLSRSEEHTSELQSRFKLVCSLLLEKKN